MIKQSHEKNNKKTHHKPGFLRCVFSEQRQWPAGIVYSITSAVVLLILILAAVMAYVVVRRYIYIPVVET